VEPNETLFADRSERAKVRFTGPQRAWFLHQVLTQAFEDIAPGEARAAAMITPHGRMTGYLDVLATEDALLAHCEPELRDVVSGELERYVFATRVEISDVTDSFALSLVVGPDWEEAAERSGALVHPTSSLGAPGAYLWAAHEDLDAVLDRLRATGAREASEEELEEVRIVGGAPRWGRDMDAKTLPQEAGIDAVAVHYDKGCYLGQEAMAKIHFRGKVNRRLRRVRTEGEWTPGSDVLAGEVKIGRVTSASNGRALALLRASVDTGARVSAAGVEATVID
jgi:folate-binding protein YgfZ